MTKQQDWIKTAEQKPAENVVVRAMDSGGHVQLLKRKGNLWWFPDESMYCYFVPTFWQPPEEQP